MPEIKFQIETSFNGESWNPYQSAISNETEANTQYERWRILFGNSRMVRLVKTTTTTEIVKQTK